MSCLLDCFQGKCSSERLHSEPACLESDFGNSFYSFSEKKKHKMKFKAVRILLMFEKKLKGIHLSLKDFQIDDKVGEGSNALVYRAYAKTKRVANLVKAQVVALRKIKQESKRSWSGAHSFYFLCEGNNHPHVVQVRSRFAKNGCEYIVLQYEPGQTIASLLQNENSSEIYSHLGMSYVLEVGIQILSALKFLHGKCISHGSITPENIIDTNRLLGDVSFSRPHARLVGMSKWKNFEADIPTVKRNLDLVRSQTHVNVSSNKKYRASDIFQFGTLLYQMIEGVSMVPSNTLSLTDFWSSQSILEFPRLNSTERGAEIRMFILDCLTQNDPRWLSVNDLHSRLKKCRKEGSF